ncbi:hypothetical protein AAF712_001708 [Marasmius tenuissimus]|uniref:Uncharacterized protein n=1 Tax=Marasmius tenuissimus TaxID=585030 RepID=A0ABR3ADR2_9AGAR|nr:hypothetical protein PM082_008180 [Marasmius tenuissimus]
MAFDMFTIRLALVCYTFALEIFHPFENLPISDGLRGSLVWQTTFFTLWNGYFYIIYFIAFLFFFALFALIRQVILFKMKRNPQFREKVEKRKALVEVKRAAKAAEDRAKGKTPESPRMVYAKIGVNLILSVIMTVNCAVWNRYTDAPSVLDGSLARFYEMATLSAQIFGYELAALAVFFPVIIAIKAFCGRCRAQRGAATGLPTTVETTETNHRRVSMDEKVLIDLSDGMDYVSEKMNLNQVPYKDEEEAELRRPLL